MGTWQEENRKKLHEILDAVLDTNGFEARSRKNTRTLPTVFMSLSGHIAVMELQIHEGGWDARDAAEPDRKFWINFDHEITDETAADVKEYLASIANGVDERTALRDDIERAEKELEEKKESIREMRERLASLGEDDDAKAD